MSNLDQDLALIVICIMSCVINIAVCITCYNLADTRLHTYVNSTVTETAQGAK